MNNFEIYSLFSVPLYHKNIGLDFEEVTKNLQYERMPANNGSYTLDKRVLNSENFNELRLSISKELDNFLYSCLSIKKKFNFHIENSWINLHHPGDHAGVHRHSNSLISGIYYISVDDNTGPIVFEKDRSFYNLFTDTVDIEFEDGNFNQFNLQAWSFVPSKGDLFLFPSLLYHYTGVNNSHRDRYSLAFNCFPRGSLGGSLNSVLL